MLAARRLSVLQQLGSLPRSVHGNTADAVRAALAVLADERTDCPLGLVYLLDDEARPGWSPRTASVSRASCRAA